MRRKPKIVNMKNDADKSENLNEAKGQASLASATGSAYLVDCDQYGKEPLEYPTISEALAGNRVVKITKLEAGRFEVREMCDEWASANLTREQLLAWAEELKALAGMPNKELAD